MDHKAWHWRKKSSEKAILTKNKQTISEKEKEEKIARLESSLQSLNEKLSLAHAECFEKDAILAKQAKVAEEAITGWEKAEADAIAIKTELEDTLHQKVAVEQRICQLDDALNVTMVERELLIKDTAKIISCEQDKVQKLEEYVAEKEKIIASLNEECSKKIEILSANEKIILELIESNKDFVVKLDSAERLNSSLQYEVCMLQKRLDIRSEERKCNIKSADASHKQHLENVRRITKLEEECKRLRSMLRKRLPGPDAIAKMRSEVETLGKNTTQTRVRTLNAMTSFDSCDLAQSSYDASHGSSSLRARLHVTEDENNAMKNSLSRKDGELQLSWTMLARTTSKLSQVEAQLEELSRGQAAAELVKRSSTVVNVLSSISKEGSNEDNISCSGSWASALISELEHLKKGKLTTPSCKSTRVSDLSFMDDFEAIEKLALLYDEKPAESYDPKRKAFESSGKELIRADNPTETTNEVNQNKIEKGLIKLIELIEGVIQESSKDYSSTHVLSSGNMGGQTGGLTGYVARAFLWKTSELTSVLQNFATVCNELLNGNTNIERFVLEVNLALDWVVNHCFSLRDVSYMREATIKNLELDNSAGLESVAVNRQIDTQLTDGTDEARTPNREKTSLVSAPNFTYIGFRAQNNTHHVVKEMSLPKFQESEGNSSSLRAELNALKETGTMITHGVDNEFGKYKPTSSYNQYKGNQQGELSLGSKLQLECYPTKDGSKHVTGSEEKHLKMQLTASEKLIECQETILNLSKQLKALTSQKDVILHDNVVHTPVQPAQKPRSQSLNEMLAVDDGEFDYLSSPKTKEIICTYIRPPHERKFPASEGGDDSATCASHPLPVVPPGRPYSMNETCKNEAAVKAVAFTIIPSKQKGNTNLLKRILVGRRKEAIMKPNVALSA